MNDPLTRLLHTKMGRIVYPLGAPPRPEAEVQKWVRECRERQKTVIFSTHVMSEVEKLCDRVGIIHAGRIVAEGTVPELLAAHGMDDLEDLFVHLVTREGEVAA